MISEIVVSSNFCFLCLPAEVVYLYNILNNTIVNTQIFLQICVNYTEYFSTREYIELFFFSVFICVTVSGLRILEFCLIENVEGSTSRQVFEVNLDSHALTLAECLEISKLFSGTHAVLIDINEIISATSVSIHGFSTNAIWIQLCSIISHLKYYLGFWKTGLQYHPGVQILEMFYSSL